MSGETGVCSGSVGRIIQEVAVSEVFSTGTLIRDYMTALALSAGRLGAALVLVFLNGFFVAAEFAYVRIRSSAVETLVKEEKPGAELLDEALDNLDDYLAVTQLGITISSLGLGWIGEPAVAALIEPVLEPLVGPNAIHLIAFALGFSVITFLHVVFGELAPKTIAIAQAERVSLFVAAPMQFFYYIFRPGIVIFNGTANYFTRLIGIPPASETDETDRRGDPHRAHAVGHRGPHRQRGGRDDRADIRPRRPVGP